MTNDDSSVLIDQLTNDIAEAKSAHKHAIDQTLAPWLPRVLTVLITEYALSSGGTTTRRPIEVAVIGKRWSGTSTLLRHLVLEKQRKVASGARVVVVVVDAMDGRRQSWSRHVEAAAVHEEWSDDVLIHILRSQLARYQARIGMPESNAEVCLVLDRCLCISRGRAKRLLFAPRTQQCVRDLSISLWIAEGRVGDFPSSETEHVYLLREEQCADAQASMGKVWRVRRFIRSIPRTPLRVHGELWSYACSLSHWRNHTHAQNTVPVPTWMNE